MLAHSKEIDDGDRSYHMQEDFMWVFRDRNVKSGMEMPDAPSEHQMDLLERIREAAGQTC